MGLRKDNIRRWAGSVFIVGFVASVLVVTASASPADDSQQDSDREMIAALNQLAFAAEEIHDVDRNYQAGELKFARKGYKHAVRYFRHALQHLEQADLTAKQREALREFEETFNAIDQDQRNLDHSTIEKARNLYDRAHDFFNSGSSG